MSVLIDLSWRLANKQIPGTDFINTLPPLLIVFIKFISWGNLRWVDLTITYIIATSGTYLFLYLVSDHKKKTIWWGVFVAIILAIPLVYTNHILDSSLSQLTGIIFFYSVYLAINSNHPRVKFLLSVFWASGFLAISKQNIALPMISAVVVFLLFLKHQDKFILISTILLGAVTGIALSMLYLGYSLASFIYTYYAVLGRAQVNINEITSIILCFESYRALALLTLGLGCLFLYSIYEKGSRISNVNKIYFLLILAISLIPIITDYDSKFNNVSLPLFIFTIGIFSSVRMYFDNSISQQDYQNHAPRILTTFVILVTIYFLSFIYGYIRENMGVRAIISFYGTDENVVIDQGYFSGLKTGNVLPGILNEIAMVKKEFPHQKLNLQRRRGKIPSL